MIKKLLVLTFGLVLIAAFDARAEYPERAITFLVPYDVGGGSDRTARALIPYLEKHLGVGTKIAVVNKPGAGGSIAYSEMASATPDGYTIGMVNLPDAVTGPMLKDLPYSVDSFNYIGGINKEPSTIAVRADSGINDLDDFVNAAKKDPGGLTVGVPSLGNVHSVGLAKLSATLGIQVNKIPLKGGGPTRNALLGGHIDAAALSVSAVATRQDELRILVQLADERAEAVPNVPTSKELGVDATNFVIRAFATPTGVPQAVIEKLRNAFKAAIEEPEFLDQASKQRIAVTFIPGGELDSISRALDRELAALWLLHPWMTVN